LNHAQSARSTSESVSARILRSVCPPPSKYDWQNSAPANSSAVSMFESSMSRNLDPVPKFIK